MTAIKWAELFPTRLSVVIFISYIILSINQSIIVTVSQNSQKKYNYNTILVVLMIEVLKLLMSAILYCRNESFFTLVKVVGNHMPLLGLYFVPSLLYCFYNNLAFINLALFDPTTYNLLLQLRVVTTALLFQFIFKKQLSLIQWVSLAMLTIGCMIKNIDYGDPAKAANSSNIISQVFSVSAVLTLIQCFCSSLAGVYNEYLLKKNGVNVDIFIQNVFMYLDSIFCNIVLIFIQGKGGEAFNAESFQSLYQPSVMIIMFNSATVGIVTSFFLKTMNSILKTFASALELVLIAILCLILFGTPLNFFTVLSLFIVTVSIIIYSQNPVNNQAKAGKTQDEVHLLEKAEDV